MTRFSLIAVLAAAALSTACASPNYTMGPDSARYVGSTYRHRDMVASSGTAAAPELDAPFQTPITEPTVHAFAAPLLTMNAPPPVAGFASGAPTPRVTQSVSVTTNKGTRTARSVPIPAKGAPMTPPPPQRTPVATAPQTTPPPPARPAQSAPRAERVVETTTGAADTPTPAAARRFIRLKISGMESAETDPMEVRRQLRAAAGVKEVVLSFKTRTAIVVVDGAVEASALVAALQSPYGAQILN